MEPIYLVNVKDSSNYDNKYFHHTILGVDDCAAHHIFSKKSRFIVVMRSCSNIGVRVYLDQIL